MILFSCEPRAWEACLPGRKGSRLEGDGVVEAEARERHEDD